MNDQYVNNGGYNRVDERTNPFNDRAPYNGEGMSSSQTCFLSSSDIFKNTRWTAMTSAETTPMPSSMSAAKSIAPSTSSTKT